MTNRHSDARAGLTLVELMVALVMLSFVLAGVLASFRSQTANFRKATARDDMLTNARYAMQQVDRLLRTAGAGVSTSQPTIVLADSLTVAFNSDYWTTTNDTVQGRCAVYLDTNAPAGSLDALTSSTTITIEGSSYSYPKATYLPTGGNCSAETVQLFFRPDSTTAVTNDWVLLQRINRQASVVIARGLYRQPSRPFFEYFVHPVTPATGTDSLLIAGASGSGISLPMIDSVTIQGGPADTGRATWADSIKAVRINVRAATTAQTGTTTRDISYVTPLINNGIFQLRTCGDSPLLTGTATATWDAASSSVLVTWPRSADETAGETDVLQYNIYRRLSTETTLGSAKYSVPIAGTATYSQPDGAVLSGSTYVYAVSAQDCSPNESAFLATASVTIP